jgi:hypothetical protein
MRSRREQQVNNKRTTSEQIADTIIRMLRMRRKKKQPPFRQDWIFQSFILPGLNGLPIVARFASRSPASASASNSRSFPNLA